MMKTRTKRLLPLMLLCIALFALALTAAAATKTGACGDNLTYTLDTDTGVLAIAGSGKINLHRANLKSRDKHRELCIRQLQQPRRHHHLESGLSD